MESGHDNEETESFESDIAEHISRLIEGKLGERKTIANKPFNQRDADLSSITGKIRLLEAINAKRCVSEEDNPPNGQNIGCHSGRLSQCCEGCSTEDELSTDALLGCLSETYKLGKLAHNQVVCNGEKMPENRSDFKLLHKQLLIAIYKDSQIRKDEQKNFIKIITQLGDIIESLKHVTKKKSHIIYNRTKNQHATEIKFNDVNDSSQQCSLTMRNQSKSDERDVRSEYPIQDNKNAIPENKFNVPSNQLPDRAYYSSTNLSDSGNNVNQMDGINKKRQMYFYYENEEFMKRKVRKINSTLKKHDKFISKTRNLYTSLQKQGKTLLSMVEDLKNEHKKEKQFTSSLLQKLEKLADNETWSQVQSIAINNLEDRFSKFEQRLVENNAKDLIHEKEMAMLKEQLKEANKVSEELNNRNLRIRNEFAELGNTLSEERKQIEDLTTAIQNERAMNESIKKSYELQLSKLVSSTVQEHKQSFMEIKKSLETQVKNLQLENNELKSRLDQMEEEWRKLSAESKLKSMKAKRFIQSHVSTASQKLIFADYKIKEFFLSIEKVLKGIYKYLYEGEFDKITRKCTDESIQTAADILGVTPSQMTKVLAADCLPHVNDWLEACRKLAYKDRFSDELSTFIISLLFPTKSKDSTKGCGDVL